MSLIFGGGGPPKYALAGFLGGDFFCLAGCKERGLKWCLWHWHEGKRVWSLQNGGASANVLCFGVNDSFVSCFSFSFLIAYFCFLYFFNFLNLINLYNFNKWDTYRSLFITNVMCTKLVKLKCMMTTLTIRKWN